MEPTNHGYGNESFYKQILKQYPISKKKKKINMAVIKLSWKIYKK